MDEPEEEQREVRLQTGLLVGISLVMITMAAAIIATVYMYNHPTSSASLFFIEVSRPTAPCWPGWHLQTFVCLYLQLDLVREVTESTSNLMYFVKA